MNNCIFCKISNKEIDSHSIYEDEICMAILAINPVAEGHSLIILKIHYESFSDVEEEILKGMIITARYIGEKSKKVLQATGYNILNATGEDAQQSVFHLHIHVVPRHKNDNLDLWFHGKEQEKIRLIETLEKYKKY